MGIVKPGVVSSEQLSKVGFQLGGTRLNRTINYDKPDKKVSVLMKRKGDKKGKNGDRFFRITTKVKKGQAFDALVGSVKKKAMAKGRKEGSDEFIKNAQEDDYEIVNIYDDDINDEFVDDEDSMSAAH